MGGVAEGAAHGEHAEAVEVEGVVPLLLQLVYGLLREAQGLLGVTAEVEDGEGGWDGGGASAEELDEEPHGLAGADDGDVDEGAGGLEAGVAGAPDDYGVGSRLLGWSDEFEDLGGGLCVVDGALYGGRPLADARVGDLRAGPGDGLQEGGAEAYRGVVEARYGDGEVNPQGASIVSWATVY